MTSSVAGLWLWSERGRLSRKEAAGSQSTGSQAEKDKGVMRGAGPEAFL